MLTGKNNGFPFLDILGYLKNTHKNPKFGRVKQVPIWELSWEFPGWDLSHFAKFGIFYGYSLNTLQYPKMGIRYFFLWLRLKIVNLLVKKCQRPKEKVCAKNLKCTHVCGKLVD